jgi:hypothetical protein
MRAECYPIGSDCVVNEKNHENCFRDQILKRGGEKYFRNLIFRARDEGRGLFIAVSRTLRKWPQ